MGDYWKYEKRFWRLVGSGLLDFVKAQGWLFASVVGLLALVVTWLRQGWEAMSNDIWSSIFSVLIPIAGGFLVVALIHMVRSPTLMLEHETGRAEKAESALQRVAKEKNDRLLQAKIKLLEVYEYVDPSKLKLEPRGVSSEERIHRIVKVVRSILKEKFMDDFHANANDDYMFPANFDLAAGTAACQKVEAWLRTKIATITLDDLRS